MYTKDERTYCDSKGAAAAASYAGRFAAKEAFLKALKTGWRGKISWHDIEVVSDKDGVPTLKISGEAIVSWNLWRQNEFISPSPIRPNTRWHR